MLQQGELGVVRCESVRWVHLDSKVGRVKRMHLCIEGSIKISYREIKMFHLPGHSIAIIATLNVSKVANETTTGSKQISVLGFAVEVIDKQGDDSPFLVIEYSKKGVDTIEAILYGTVRHPKFNPQKRGPNSDRCLRDSFLRSHAQTAKANATYQN